MARTKSNGNGPEKSSANLGFESKLWLAADQAVPAPNRDAAECIGGRAPAPGLGLIFLKYIFDKHHTKLLVGRGTAWRRR